MDRLSKILLTLIGVFGLLGVASAALAAADGRTPARASAAQLQLPDGHERMLGLMRAGAHSHHLERMRADPDWQSLRGPTHRAHLEAYQAEIDRMLGHNPPR